MWSIIRILNGLQLRFGLGLGLELRVRLGVSVNRGELNVFVVSRHLADAYAFELYIRPAVCISSFNLYLIRRKFCLCI